MFLLNLIETISIRLASAAMDILVSPRRLAFSDMQPGTLQIYRVSFSSWLQTHDSSGMTFGADGGWSTS